MDQDPTELYENGGLQPDSDDEIDDNPPEPGEDGEETDPIPDDDYSRQDEERRLTLQARLTQIAPKAWLRRPSSNRMTYPCILYRPSKPVVWHADNKMYSMKSCWNVIYISQNPDEAITRKMLESFEYCRFDREYESDNLYHYSFILYY